MKPIDEIKEIPNLRLYMPDKEYGIAKIKLQSTMHYYKSRLVFSCFGGMDMVMIMFKKNKRATPEEIAEVKEMFFTPEEIPQCEVILHPDNEKITVIYRPQEGLTNGA